MACSIFVALAVAGCKGRVRHYLDPDPVEPIQGRIWSIQYSRHGGIAGVSLDMSMADDGRTRVRVPSPSRTIREGTAAPQRLAEISTLLAKMVKAGELVPRANLADSGSCSDMADCQTVDLTVSYRGKTYTFGPSGGDLYIPLLGGLELAAQQVAHP
jgi:hypothetical protein